MKKFEVIAKLVKIWGNSRFPSQEAFNVKNREISCPKIININFGKMLIENQFIKKNFLFLKISLNETRIKQYIS